MTQMTGGQLVAKALRQEGIQTIFTLAGGHIMDIYNGCLEEDIRIIDVRHEQSAVHAAEAWTRLTGITGTAVVTAGPGVTDAVTGVANAFRNQTPLLVIGGQTPRRQFLMGGLQELDHTAIMKPITKLSITIMDTDRIPELLGMAFREAYNGRPGPVFVEIPMDVLNDCAAMDHVVFPKQYRSKGQMPGHPDLIEQAADLLNKAARPGHPCRHTGVALPCRHGAERVRPKVADTRISKRRGQGMHGTRFAILPKSFPAASTG